MIKIKKIIKKIYVDERILLFLFLIPFIIIFFYNWQINNDSWFLFNHGRYVLEHGIPYIEPFTIHEGLNFVMQQWLSSVIFYLPYKLFGELGVFFLVMLTNALMLFMLYKLCMLISNNNKQISTVVSVLIDSLIVYYGYITSRPQIFTFLVLIIFVYVIERYIKNKNKKILLLLPLLSILEMNLHASTWWMLIIVCFPFTIELFYQSWIKKSIKKYYFNYFIIIISLVFFAGLINPYGIDAMLYLFNSMDDLISFTISEMKQPSVFELSTIITLLFLFVYLLILMNYYKKNNELKIGYLIMILITFLLSLHTYKELAFFYILGIYSLAYFLSDKKLNSKKAKGKIKLLHYVIIVTSLGLFGYELINKIHMLEHPTYVFDDARKYLEENYDTKSLILYADYNSGAYFQFYGYKTYMDARAEVFLKSLNKKEDIYYERNNLSIKAISLDDFLNKYNFTHIITYETDILYDLDSNLYELKYDKDKIRIYVHVYY